MSSDAVLPQAAHAPLFIAYVEEVFSQFVDELGERLRQKSKDDLECIGVTDWSKWDSTMYRPALALPSFFLCLICVVFLDVFASILDLHNRLFVYSFYFILFYFILFYFILFYFITISFCVNIYSWILTFFLSQHCFGVQRRRFPRREL